LGVNASPNDDGQLVIVMVARDSIAEAAGLLQGDVIVKWGEDELKNRRGLRKVIRRDKGSTVKLLVLREGKEQTIDLKLARPDEE
jgi:S1-C subfamily serine protease